MRSLDFATVGYARVSSLAAKSSRWHRAGIQRRVNDFFGSGGLVTPRPPLARRRRIRNLDKPAKMPYQPIETMNNTASQRARAVAGLGDLHVHDLRHTVGMRLREVGIPDGTIQDFVAQMSNDHAALHARANR